jgi:hypothetical protein
MDIVIALIGLSLFLLVAAPLYARAAHRNKKIFWIKEKIR